MRLLFLICLSAMLFSCNDSTTSKPTNSESEEVSSEVSTAAVTRMFPKGVGPIFEAHGGIANWDRMNNLCFQIEKASGVETHSTDLKSRKTRIEHENWTIGYNGQDVWLDQETEAYKGNARFYHNLYFYFYAMPFIVSDPGITYAQLNDPLVVAGKSYNGTLISYNDGVGDSPKDQYIVYTDPDTGKMAWLGYTVTYMDGEAKDNFNYIKYNTWQEVNGLMLPEELVWYTVENGVPVAPRNSVKFSKVSVTETILDEALFVKPETATIVPR